MREKTSIEARALKAADHILKTKGTIRSTAEALGVSRTTVNNDLRKVLPELDGELYQKVVELFEANLRERYTRGGIATREKREQEKEEEEND